VKGQPATELKYLPSSDRVTCKSCGDTVVKKNWARHCKAHARYKDRQCPRGRPSDTGASHLQQRTAKQVKTLVDKVYVAVCTNTSEDVLVRLAEEAAPELTSQEKSICIRTIQTVIQKVKMSWRLQLLVSASWLTIYCQKYLQWTRRHHTPMRQQLLLLLLLLLYGCWRT